MKKKLTMVAALMTVIALVVTGTFAWQKVIEKRNEFMGNKKDVTVHDDFDPDTGLKDVYAENRGNTVIYVRIKFEETMSLTSDTWRPGPNDWVTHTHGQVAVDCGHVNVADGKPFHDYFKWTMGGWKYYMPGTGTQSVVQDKNEYDGTEPGVRKTPDAAIVTSERFLAMGEDEQKAFVGWIFATDGYAYWSQPLEKGEVTGLLLHGVDPQPILKDMDYYYAINVIVEVVDLRDIPMWTDGAPSVDGSGTTHPKAPPDGKEVIGIIVGNGGEGGDPNGPGGPSDKDLPVRRPDGGFTPITDRDPRIGDGYYAKINFLEYGNPDPNYNLLYHTGSVHLEDIITDGNYDGVTATAVDAKYAPYITVGLCERHGGKPSVIFSYEPTNMEFLTMQLGDGINASWIPVQVRLVRGDGREAVVSVNMVYNGSLVTMDASVLDL